MYVVNDVRTAAEVMSQPNLMAESEVVERLTILGYTPLQAEVLLALYLWEWLDL
jgi:hypothetical protein